MSIFDKRTAFKPFEYDISQYKDAINHSYWLVSEWNFISDIHDFSVNLSESEKNAIKNALLAISQIEISVKKFWTNLGDRFPKAEFEQVGVTFGESEVRHADAYSHLLQVLGLNDDFNQLLENPVIQGRVDYLTKYLSGAAENSNEKYTLTLTLFSIFIENVSLFSQFLIIKSFNKYRNILKDIDNVVQATQKEECYSSDTEVLTPEGWKFLSDIKVGEEIYQYDNGEISPTNVLHKIEKTYSGDMFEIGHKSSNCLVTPNHDMVYFNSKNKLCKEKAIDIKYHSKIKVPCGGIIDNKDDFGLTWEERLRIAIQSDGTNLYWIDTNQNKHFRGKNGGYTHSFKLTKQRKKDRLKLILNHLSIEFNEINTGLETEFKIRYNHDFDYKEFNWVSFINKSQKWCVDFVQEAIEWDGYRNITNTGFSNTNKAAIDKVHAAAVLAGYRTNILTKIDKRGYKNTYKVSISKRSLIPAGHGYKKEKISYNGKVYCVTVPSGVIITRRKGKVAVAGNCIHALFGVFVIKQIQKEFPEWLNEEFYEKLNKACKKAYEAECNIIDWIFEKGDLPFLSRDSVKEFIKNRFNESLEMLGAEKVFEIDMEKIAPLQWFEDEIHAEVNTDFFHKKPVTYSKKSQAIKAQDLF